MKSAFGCLVALIPAMAAAGDPPEKTNLYEDQPTLVAELSALLKECRGGAKP